MRMHARTYVLLEQAFTRGAPFSLSGVLSAIYYGQNHNKVPCHLLADVINDLQWRVGGRAQLGNDRILRVGTKVVADGTRKLGSVG